MTKLLIDMNSNSGGVVKTAYFLTLALYPEMDFFDWANLYNVRVSKEFQEILDINALYSTL